MSRPPGYTAASPTLAPPSYSDPHQTPERLLEAFKAYYAQHHLREYDAHEFVIEPTMQAAVNLWQVLKPASHLSHTLANLDHTRSGGFPWVPHGALPISPPSSIPWVVGSALVDRTKAFLAECQVELDKTRSRTDVKVKYVIKRWKLEVRLRPAREREAATDWPEAFDLVLRAEPFHRSHYPHRVRSVHQVVPVHPARMDVCIPIMVPRGHAGQNLPTRRAELWDRWFSVPPPSAVSSTTTTTTTSLFQLHWSIHLPQSRGYYPGEALPAALLATDFTLYPDGTATQRSGGGGPYSPLALEVQFVRAGGEAASGGGGALPAYVDEESDHEDEHSVGKRSESERGMGRRVFV
ncbi:hypothetical protein JCM8097_000022 [Rhodosporidiobolus ruineniae]